MTVLRTCAMSCLCGGGGHQVEAKAVSKYGSLDNLELHREQQQMTKIRQRIAKRKAETQKVRDARAVEPRP